MPGNGAAVGLLRLIAWKSAQTGRNASNSAKGRLRVFVTQLLCANGLLPRYWDDLPRKELGRMASAARWLVASTCCSSREENKAAGEKKDLLTWERLAAGRKIEVEVGASQKAGLQGPWLPNEMINST
jgi:hypothetical protein